MSRVARHLFLVMVTGFCALCQTDTGNLSGVVVDSSQAAVPGRERRSQYFSFFKICPSMPRVFRISGDASLVANGWWQVSQS